MLIRICMGIIATTTSGDVPRDVTRIFAEHCADCHRPNGAAPFDLYDLRHAKKRARQILDVTTSGYMPPWLPTDTGLSFQFDRRLTDREKATLAAWVAADTPTGASSVVGEPDKGWALGEPDIVLVHDEPYTVAAGGGEILHTFVIPTNLDEDIRVRAIEFQPGNARVLHHVAFLIDDTGQALLYDRSTPGPGYPAMGSIGWTFAGSFATWSPGDRVIEAPRGMSWPVPAGSHVSMELHLTPTGKPELLGVSKIGLYLARPEDVAPITAISIGSLCIDIPPGDSNYVLEESWPLPVDITLIGISPSARYLCRAVSIGATLPAGEEIPLLQIDEWDFNWQRSYWLEQPMCIPAGTCVHTRFVFDNSEANPRNPSDPPVRVRLGHDVEDELALTLLHVATDSPEDLAALETAHRQQVLRRIEQRRDLDRRRNPDP